MFIVIIRKIANIKLVEYYIDAPSECFNTKREFINILLQRQMSRYEP